MQLTTTQKEKVNLLIEAYKNRGKNKYAFLKAPTGSGKTFMASSFISQTLALNHSNKIIFIVATISNADLPKQFAKKLSEYQKFHTYSNYKIEHIISPSNSKNAKQEDIPSFTLENNKVFVFGVSSFRKNTLFYENKTLETFFQQAQAEGYKVLFIRDEAHIGRKPSIAKNDLKNFDEKVKENADFILEMTATPKDKNNLIEMTHKELEQDGLKLLKSNMQKSKLSGEISTKEIVEDAIQEYKKSKKEYQTLSDAIINPAMLIQVRNDSKINKVEKQRFDDTLSLLESELQKAGLKYLKYLDKHEVVGTKVPPTLEYASQLDSEIDVIIFKVGPATGWDIPRANMLLQIRNVSSESLNVQTLGRIKRNPYPGLERNAITDKYYLWSNYQQPTRDQATYILKKKFHNTKMFSGIIDKNGLEIQTEQTNYIEEVKNWITSQEFLAKIKDFNPKNQLIYDVIQYGDAINIEKIENHLNLKIYNLNKRNELQNKYIIDEFDEHLVLISKKSKKNIEVIKYIFYNSITIMEKIRKKHLKWVESPDSYEINDNAPISQCYNIWVDNKATKKVDTSNIENYGYKLISSEHDGNIQFLDSEPEKRFFQQFNDIISDDQRKNILFFAKMPTLGSGVYYEYYSEINGKIAKSYMDFALVYKDKTIMFEVKSKDKDYSEDKTKELIYAYEKYMNKFSNLNIELIIYQWDSEKEQAFISCMIEGVWKTDIGFRDVLDNILK